MSRGDVRVLVLADTHLRAGTVDRLPAAVLDAAATVDAILHAGDVVTPDLLDLLGSLAPVHAVLGNNDDAALAARLPERLEVDLSGVRIGMVHDSGATAGRPRRLRRAFPDADVVVFGHSHVPVDELGVDGQLLFNPGSPTQRRRQPVRTYGHLVLRDGAVAARAVVPIPV